jgi:hypothetical protein
VTQGARKSGVSQKSDFLADALHIFVLCSFALAQPLFDLLARSAEFFVAHRSQPLDIFLNSDKRRL